MAITTLRNERKKLECLNGELEVHKERDIHFLFSYLLMATAKVSHIYILIIMPRNGQKV